jgi:hypothetical protein
VNDLSDPLDGTLLKQMPARHSQVCTSCPDGLTRHNGRRPYWRSRVAFTCNTSAPLRRWERPGPLTAVLANAPHPLNRPMAATEAEYRRVGQVEALTGTLFEC